jgi:hypothetical protein
MYVPSPADCAVRSADVDTFLAVMVAPGMTAAVVSFTVPENVPVFVCAFTVVVLTRSTSARIKLHLTACFIYLPPFRLSKFLQPCWGLEITTRLPS